ncbi:hypothetical protein CsatB_019803 [Cannabis sativa]
MKIDLSKAYDTVDWQFVEDLLNGLCFPMRFIHWLLTCLRGSTYFLLLNGRIQGSFKGEKGLRQGDPLSPLVFVLIMEYLSRLLSFYSSKKGFGFHPLCKNMRLTNLCFADDLIIFCKGNVKSVELVNAAFLEFCQATGLASKKRKSHVYFGGVNEEIKSKILELIQMEEGTFPLKYLGVVLRPTKWKASNCGVILDKLSLKLSGWASRNLSFAGRAQLIRSVLLGIRNFWMSLFILPKKIVDAIDKKCRDFLWGMNGNISKLHIPSWEKVCLPKQFGGIGFREGKKWNSAMIAKHVCAISSKQDNLWVKWINSIYLKDEDFWSISANHDFSWYFKKILKIRMMTNNVMLDQAAKGNKFKVSKFYVDLIGPAKSSYATSIWHRFIVPKHRFIFWQIMNEQLLTRDLLSKFLPITSALCTVCEDAMESHNHLFIDCIFTKKVIAGVENWAGILSWPKSFSELQQRCFPTKPDFAEQVLNSVFEATLYHIWRNRNDCLFNAMCLSASCISKSIRNVVKTRIIGFHCTSSKKKDRYAINVVNSW